jgi:uncharacterized repeat protein (TIGR01451 family)
MKLSLVPTVTSAATDPNPGNSTVTVDSAVANVADLAVSVSGGPEAVTRGDTVTYTITVTNAGPVAATTAAVSVDIPAGTLFQSFTFPDGWAPATPAVGSGGAVSATIASFPSGGSATFVLTLTTQGDGEITLTAKAGATTPDPISANDTQTRVTLLAGAPSPTSGAIDPKLGGLPLSGSSLVRLAGATVVLLGFIILLIAAARSRRYRRG